VRYSGRKLVLFFAVQALGVAAMIVVVAANSHPVCGLGGCYSPPAAPVILSVLFILGELGVVAVLLRASGRVWRSLMGIGVVSLLVALICACTIPTCAPHQNEDVLVVWHLVLGALLLTAGSVASVSDLLERWRRPDDAPPDDKRALEGMWPLD
jgi:hypothetical protein